MDNTSDIQTDKFLYEHALGALNGLAIGDALGMPSQTLTTQEIKEHYGVITDFVHHFLIIPFRMVYMAVKSISRGLTN
ncbi:MAG: ADP-ribosylglycohydrolase family protein [Candidatus Puniceispirillales bacterium]|nr:ADP-ribosylglycohydrolase family protein [Pseudomonadota bacterium]